MKVRVFLLGLVLLASFAVWRVASAPIRVDFLTPYFEEMLSRNEQGWRLNVAETVLAWRGWSKPLDLNLRDVEIHDRNGKRIVNLPVVSLGFSLSALVHGKVAARRVEILRAELLIERDATGHVAMRGETTNQGHDVTGFASTLIETLLMPRDPAYPLSFLEVVRVEAARITWADTGSKIELSAAPATFDARRTATGLGCEVVLQLGSGNGAATSAPKLHVVAEAHPTGGETAAAIAGVVDIAAADFAVSLVARARDVRVADLRRYWPEAVARSARAWVTENIRSGKVGEAVLNLAFYRRDGQVRLNSLDGTLAYSNLRVRYLDEWPEAASVSGNATFDRQGLRFNVASGVVGDLSVGRSTVEITGLDSDDEKIRIQAPVSGSSNEIAEIVSRQSADLVELLALDSTAPADQGTANLEIAFPLEDGLSLAKVTIDARADLPALQVRNPYVDGVVGAGIDFKMLMQGKANVGLDVDLSKAEMTVPFFGWRKQEGEGARAQVSVDLEDLRPTRAHDLKIDAGTLQARGELRFREKGRKLESVELEEVAVGQTRLSTVTVKDSADGWRIEVGRGNVDVEAIRRAPVGENEKGAARTGSGNVVLVAPRLQRVSFGADRYLEDVSVHAEHDGDGWRNVDVGGKTPGTRAGKFKLELKPMGGGQRRLALQADDAGSLFRILGVTAEVRGGRLNVAGQTAAGGKAPLQARVEMRDYAFLRSSLLIRLLTLASGRGFGKLATGDSVAFDYLGGDIGFSDGRAAIELVRTHGPALGITAKGWVDIEGGVMELDGAIVPAYTANRVLGRIPVLGGLLSGDGKEGFWAIRYRVEGNPRDPKMEVNTLESLTPAFLRDLFGSLEAVTER